MIVYKNEREERPWGEFTTHACGDELTHMFKVKTMIINPNQRLSLQHHDKRKEVWVVAAGVAKVELDNEVFFATPGKVVNIPVKAKHRVSCASPNPCVIVELQMGEECAESDITRHEDDYARKT